MIKLLIPIALIAVIVFAVCGVMYFIFNTIHSSTPLSKRGSFKEFFDHDKDEFV